MRRLDGHNGLSGGTIEQTPQFPRPEIILSYVTGDEAHTCAPGVDCIEYSPWHVEYEVSLDLPYGESFERMNLQVLLPAARSWCIDPDRRLTPVGDSTSPPWPVGCFVVVQHENRLFQVQLGGGAYPRLVQTQGTLAVTLTVRHRRACGLRLWGEEKFSEFSCRKRHRLSVSRLNTLDEALWVEPFPSGARSCICVTDHPDWDSTEKSSALLRLFVKNGIRITKAVFPASDPGWDYGPGLDSAEYSAVIDRWYEAGHEIAYHGLGSGREPPPSAEDCLCRLDALNRFGPRTWIDHGSGDYRFVKHGTLPGGISLHKCLAERGVRNYWSYADIWQNPASDLHVWRQRRATDAMTDFFRLALRRGATGLRQFAYLGSIPVKNLTGDGQYRQVLSQPWARSNWSELCENARLLRELRAGPLYLYCESGDFWPGTEAADLVFDTVLLNHVSLQLTPSNLERLARDSGLLLAHTYLSDTARRGGRNCFRARGKLRILDQFRENVEHISMLQSRGDVVTAPLQDLRDALSQHARTRLTRCADGWRVDGRVTVCSHAPYKVAGEHVPSDRYGLHRATATDRLFLSLP